jgi:uncharacterized repeat protein (TIGR01451 family)
VAVGPFRQLLRVLAALTLVLAVSSFGAGAAGATAGGGHDDSSRCHAADDDGKHEDGKPDDGGHDDGKHDDGKPDDGKPDDGGHDDGKHDDGKHDDGKHDDGKPDAKTHEAKAPGDEKPAAKPKQDKKDDESRYHDDEDCAPAPVVAPSGELLADCYAHAGRVAARALDKGTADTVSWRLVTGTDGAHTTSLATRTGDGPLSVGGLADGTPVWLQYDIGAGWVDEGAKVVTADCEPDEEQPPAVVEPTGSYTVECSDTGALVTVGQLAAGTRTDVVWTLTVGGSSQAVVTGAVVPVPAGAPLALSFSAKDVAATVVQHSTAPAACPPREPVHPRGLFTAACTATGALVTIGQLSPGTLQDVAWTLTHGTASQVVTSGQTVAVPGGAALALSFVARGQASTVVQSDTAPAACPPVGQVDKTASPASGTVVGAGQVITYTVTARNTGAVPISGTPLVDRLPLGVSVVPGSVTGGGVLDATDRSVTWTVSLAPSQTATFSYRVTVDAGTAVDQTLVNRATFLQDDAVTTHTVGARGLSVVKSVDPAGEVLFGGTLTYTLVVRATGNLGQDDVRVTDYVPGHRPGADSGLTVYAAGSAACDTAGPCTATFDEAQQLVTWQLGAMAAGSTRTVTFAVAVQEPEETEDGGIPAVTIRNSGAAASAQVAETPSNEVETPVTAVLGVKTPNPPSTSTPQAPTEVLGGGLPRTGPGTSIGWTVTVAGLLVLVGALMVALPNRRRGVPRRRV